MDCEWWLCSGKRNISTCHLAQLIRNKFVQAVSYDYHWALIIRAVLEVYSRFTNNLPSKGYSEYYNSKTRRRVRAKLTREDIARIFCNLVELFNCKRFQVNIYFLFTWFATTSRGKSISIPTVRVWACSCHTHYGLTDFVRCFMTCCRHTNETASEACVK